MIDYSDFLAKDGYVIFLFHGVIPKNSHKVRNYTGKHIEKDRFTEVLKDLSGDGKPVSLDRIVYAHQLGETLPEKAFAVTFDDGFANNYEIAAPILFDLKIPATFYATTGFIGTDNASWIDLLEYAFENIRRIDFKHPLFGGEVSASSDSEKIKVLQFARDKMKNSAEIDVYGVASEILKQLGIDKIIPDPYLDKKMSWDQLRRLGSEDLFEIGGHGHTHRILSHLEDGELQKEIDASIDCLENNLSGRIRHYSYPEGLKHCFSEKVISALKKRGIICSPTAIPGKNKITDDLFRLRRVLVDGERGF